MNAFTKIRMEAHEAVVKALKAERARGIRHIVRDTKRQNRHKKAITRANNARVRAEINSAFSNSSKGPHNKTPVWNGARNGVPIILTPTR